MWRPPCRIVGKFVTQQSSTRGKLLQIACNIDGTVLVAFGRTGSVAARQCASDPARRLHVLLRW